ncbi:MAG: HlyD family secretion protein [Blastocatellia bacterium]
MTRVVEPETDVREKPDTDETRPKARSIIISPDDVNEAKRGKKPFYKRPLILIPACLVLLVGLIFGVRFYVYASAHESTDDAFVDGHIIPISPKVAGYVMKLHITDNQHVEKGDLLLEIDPRDYEARLAEAQANLQAAIARHSSSQINVQVTSVTTNAAVEQAASGVDQARSNVRTTQAQVFAVRSRLDQARTQIKTAQANAEHARSQVVAAEADAVRTARDHDRYEELLKLDEVSRQQFDNATAAARIASAQLDSARLRVAAAETQVADARAAEQAAAGDLSHTESQVDESKARVGEARGQLAAARAAPQQIAASRSQVAASSAEIQQAQAAIQQAELNLSYTKIYAPESGRVTRRTVEEGAYLQVAQSLFAIVPDDLWVTANFKETQLTQMQPGQPAQVEVDAYPGKVFNAHVDSIQRGSGAAFSLLPPENATGNYVKVVQRVPVKIVFDEPLDPGYALGPGMSVTPTVKVK